MPSMTDMLTFEAAAARFRQASLTPRDYLEQAIAIIQEKEDRVRAFACLDLDRARAQADAATERYRRQAPLSAIDGMPVGIKDIIDTATLPTTMGSDIYRGWQPAADAEAVDAIRLGGGIILGKTHTTEFAIGRATVTTNPHDATRTPGGSSSGTAAAVASGMICAGLGTQTQGSIVRPASYCGVAGYKPTWGVLPLRGVHPVSSSHDHLGVIAQSLDTAWTTARCIMHYRPTPASAQLDSRSTPALEARPAGRVAVLRTQGYAELDADALRAFDAQLDNWRRAGAVLVEPGDDPHLAALCHDLDQIPSLSQELVSHDMRWPYWSYCQQHPQAISRKIHDMVEAGLKITPQRYAGVCAMRDGILARLEALASHYDAFMLPAASGVAPVGLDNTGSRTLLVYGSFLGIPALSLPVLQVGHMPLGIQLLGPRFSDHPLLCHGKWLVSLAGT
ncbi:amidase [Bordetella sp. BOR01]|uniref:amidase n=1 Tax=Bordetella sp. BOR01 TaxID=2854779 RepID=UPI001C43ABD2|nr:amidase [Bordetella sp. BOR01]MBV7484396.1 amidase [Bordetella sp. BOR01]